jgi:hypothetical protein
VLVSTWTGVVHLSEAPIEIGIPVVTKIIDVLGPLVGSGRKLNDVSYPKDEI